IIADENADPEYGTGAVGVTPAHSPADYEMYEKNKEIGLIPVIGKDGRMTEESGKNYQGLTVLEARKKFVSWLKENDLLIKEEEAAHSVGASDRFGDVVEALPMEQWFVDVNRKLKNGKSLKDLLKDAVTVGHNKDKGKIIKIKPERFKNIYLRWIDHLRDWCISRQVWWGHRIPVWYKGKEVKVGETSPGEGWVQDEDTLDTWFSSGAWTFSTLGWPEKTDDLKKYHPTSWMQMGYEILFFWMARMILMSAYALDDIPFKQVYIHGILRDKDGRKFSKSLGNGLDPLEIIRQYGTDALRLSLVKGIAPGNDARFYPEKVEGARNFVNKLWNISRYVFQTVKEVKLVEKKPEARSLWDEYILNKLEAVIASVTSDLNEFEFSRASEALHDFTWGDFADWYLEVSKIEKNKDENLLFLLQNILKLWHPFCPFVTEEIWRNFGTGDMLMVAPWPGGKIKRKDFKDIEKIKEIITAIRNLRSENGIEPAKLAKAVIISKNKKGLVEDQSLVIQKLSRLEELTVLKQGSKPEESIAAVLPEVEIYLLLSGIINVKEEREKLEKGIKDTEEYIKGLEKKLDNAEFTVNAPKAVVDKEKEKLAMQKEKAEKLKKQLEGLG
ncbi:MAG: class I tRNA ligase family protein, partial [Patescibacteria group bacterium]